MNLPEVYSQRSGILRPMLIKVSSKVFLTPFGFERGGYGLGGSCDALGVAVEDELAECPDPDARFSRGSLGPLLAWAGNPDIIA